MWIYQNKAEQRIKEGIKPMVDEVKVNVFVKKAVDSTDKTKLTPSEQNNEEVIFDNSEATKDTKDYPFDSNNAASLTVIASDDYQTAIIEAQNLNEKGLADFDFDAEIKDLEQSDEPIEDKSEMKDLITSQYGENLTEGEMNSAAWSIVDNNRWMMEDINRTYLETQVMNTLIGDSEYTDEDLATINSIAKKSVIASKVAKGEINQTSDAAFSKEEWDFIKANNIDWFAAASTLTTKDPEKAYDQFDENIRTDKIPPELIYATDFSNNEKGKDGVFMPTLTTLQADNDAKADTIVRNVEFNSKEKDLAIDVNGLSQEDAINEIKNQIAQNYGIDDLNNIQGSNILSALGKEEGNNEIFDKKQENVEDFVNAIYDYASKNGGKVDLSCPDTAISVLFDDAQLKGKDIYTKGKLDEAKLEKYAREFVTSEQSTEMSYLHSKTDSISLDEWGDKPLTGVDILKNIEYGDTTLGDAISEMLSKEGPIDQSLAALGVSALQQIGENNPAIAERLNDSLNDDSLTDKDIFMTLLNETDYAQIMENANSHEGTDENKIVLENIQYTHVKEKAPVVAMAVEEEVEVEEEETTTPEPPITTPEPPPTTTPEPPPIVTPEPPPTEIEPECPDNPDGEGDDDSIDINRPNLPENPDNEETTDDETTTPETPEETDPPTNTPTEDFPPSETPEETDPPTNMPTEDFPPSETPEKTDPPTNTPTEDFPPSETPEGTPESSTPEIPEGSTPEGTPESSTPEGTDGETGDETNDDKNNDFTQGDGIDSGDIEIGFGSEESFESTVQNEIKSEASQEASELATAQALSAQEEARLEEELASEFLKSLDGYDR